METESPQSAESVEKNEEQSSIALTYKSFLVRVWRDGDDCPWRASVTHVQTKETRQFMNVQALFVYLNNQVST